MEFEVRYELLVHGSDRPVRECKKFAALDIKGAQRTGNIIARNRAKEIEHAGGAALVRSVQVKPCYKSDKT